MNRTELLEWIKPRISEYYYDILVAWTKIREKKLFWKRKFLVEPVIYGKGYIIDSGKSFDSIIVHPDNWFL